MASPPEAGFIRALRSRLPVSARTHRAALVDLAAARREAKILEREAAAKGKLQKVADDLFGTLCDEAKKQDRTKLDRNRLWVLWETVRNAAPLDGAAAEVGAYRGGSAYFIAASFAALAGQAVTMEVIDTFDGHRVSQVTEHDHAVYGGTELFGDASYEDVVEYLAPFPHVTVHKGEFSAVAPALPDRRYRLVHLDVDIYAPTMDGLRYFGPRLVSGGIVVLDDYDKPSCPGIRAAAEAFLSESTDFQSWTPRTKQFVLVKR